MKLHPSVQPKLGEPPPERLVGTALLAHHHAGEWHAAVTQAAAGFQQVRESLLLDEAADREDERQGLGRRGGRAEKIGIEPVVDGMDDVSIRAAALEIARVGLRAGGDETRRRKLALEQISGIELRAVNVLGVCGEAEGNSGEPAREPRDVRDAVAEVPVDVPCGTARLDVGSDMTRLEKLLDVDLACLERAGAVAPAHRKHGAQRGRPAQRVPAGKRKLLARKRWEIAREPG